MTSTYNNALSSKACPLKTYSSMHLIVTLRQKISSPVTPLAPKTFSMRALLRLSTKFGDSSHEHTF